MLLVSVLLLFAKPEVKLVLVFRVAAIQEFGNLCMHYTVSICACAWLNASSACMSPQVWESLCGYESLLMQGQKTLHQWRQPFRIGASPCRVTQGHASPRWVGPPMAGELAGWQDETHEPRVQERSMPVLTSALKMSSTSAGVLPLFLR